MGSIFQGVRLVVILLSFAAMWSLWDARRKRGKTWTSKLRDIWLVQIGWTIATAEANIELYYGHRRPTVAIVAIIFLLLWTIKGAFNPHSYLRE